MFWGTIASAESISYTYKYVLNKLILGFSLTILFFHSSSKANEVLHYIQHPWVNGFLPSVFKPGISNPLICLCMLLSLHNEHEAQMWRGERHVSRVVRARLNDTPWGWNPKKPLAITRSVLFPIFESLHHHPGHPGWLGLEMNHQTVFPKPLFFIPALCSLTCQTTDCHYP